jgi:putative ABC transport system permease protein
MFQNYIKTALRNLLRQKLFSIINVLGLAVGLAACILITLFVRDELSYDEFWSDADRIHRFHTTFNVPGREPFITVVAPGPIKEPFERYFSEEVAYSTRFVEFGPVVGQGNDLTTESIHWVDREVADIFDLNIVRGDYRSTFDGIARLAINQSFAEKYFGDKDPIGQVLTVNNFYNTRDYQVTAVFEDLPHNTAMDFQALTLIDEADFVSQPGLFESWFSLNASYFFKLKDGIDAELIESRLKLFTDTEIDIPPGALGDGFELSDIVKYSILPLVDVQLTPSGSGEMKPTGDVQIVLIFSAIAGLILLIACINFMNLATAKSTQRAREVALRKVLGAKRKQLVQQFIGESILISILSLLLAIVFLEISLPTFSQFVGKDLAFDYTDGFSFSILLGLIVFIGIVGGLYPAMVLSGFRPAFVLKANKSAEDGSSARLRNILVITQFAISIALIVATIVVYGQMQFAVTMDPGFNKENLLVVRNLGRPSVLEKQDTFKEEIARLPGVSAVALSGNSPSNGDESNTSVEIPGNAELGSILVGYQDVDHDFFETYQMQLLAGRAYSRDYSGDGVPDSSTIQPGDNPTGTVIINQSALGRFGFETPEGAVGKDILLGVRDSTGERVNAALTVIGVVPDVHFQSLKTVIRPEIYLLNFNDYRSLTVRFSGSSASLISAIEGLWNGLGTNVPYRYKFVDEAMAGEFGEEQALVTMLGLFAVLAILIACLGLYGLASFTAERRTKEIGIRKVMGATVLDIVRLLVWQFSKPVLVASLIAWPVAIWAMMNWLETFPYRLETWILVPLCLFAALLALSIAWATIGGNAAKVARSNPIKALRYE